MLRHWLCLSRIVNEDVTHEWDLSATEELIDEASSVNGKGSVYHQNKRYLAGTVGYQSIRNSNTCGLPLTLTHYVKILKKKNVTKKRINRNYTWAPAHPHTSRWILQSSRNVGYSDKAHGAAWEHPDPSKCCRPSAALSHLCSHWTDYKSYLQSLEKKNIQSKVSESSYITDVALHQHQSKQCVENTSTSLEKPDVRRKEENLIFPWCVIAHSH